MPMGQIPAGGSAPGPPKSRPSASRGHTLPPTWVPGPPKWVPRPRPIPKYVPQKWVPKWDPKWAPNKKWVLIWGPIFVWGPFLVTFGDPFLFWGPFWVPFGDPFSRDIFRGIGRDLGTHFGGPGTQVGGSVRPLEAEGRLLGAEPPAGI